MPNRKWIRYPAVVGIAGLLLASARVAFVWATAGRSQADAEASALGFLVTAATAITTIVAYLARRLRPTSDEVDEALLVLVKQLRERWTREAAILALDSVMPVRWQLTGTPVPRDRMVGGTDTVALVVEWYQALRPGRLAVVGTAGQGKTTLAIRMLLSMLPAPSAPITGSVPVLLSIASWQTGDRTLREWIAARLQDDFPALRNFSPAVRREVAGRVLPILDGLDELDPAHRSDFARRVDEDGGALIITSREKALAELGRSGQRPTVTATIRAQALTPDGVATYLEDADDSSDHRWSTVVGALRAERAPVLADATRNPLGLWLVRQVYSAPGTRPAELIDQSRFGATAKLLAHLLDELPQALVAIRPPLPGDPLRPRREHSPEKLTSLLTRMAGQLETAEGDGPAVARNWQWWQLPRYERFHPVTRMAVGILCALLMVGPVATVPFTAFGLKPWLGPLTAVLVGVVFAVASGVSRRPRRVALRLLKRQRNRTRRAAVALIVAAGAGAVVGIAGGLPYGQHFGLVGGIGTGLAVGLAGLVVALFGSADPEVAAATPLFSYRADRRATWTAVLVTFVVGVLAGAVGGVLGAEIGNLKSGDLVGMSRGAVAGVPGGLVLGLLVAVVVYPWPAVVLFGRSRQVFKQRPGRLMRTLDDCHRLGLLRQAGSSYQFRHAWLQDHLSAAWREAADVRRRQNRTGRLVTASVVAVVVACLAAVVVIEQRRAAAREEALVRWRDEQLAQVTQCLPGAWDLVAIRIEQPTRFGSALLTGVSGGSARWTFTTGGALTTRGPVSMRGTLIDSSDRGRSYEIRFTGAQRFTYTLRMYAWDGAQVLLDLSRLTSYEVADEFVGGRSRGRRVLTVEGIEHHYEVTCSGDTMAVTDAGMRATYRRQ